MSPPTIEPRKTPLLSGHTVEPFAGEKDKKLEELFPGHSYGMIRMQPGGCVMVKPFLLFHDRLMSFKFEPTDVVVMTFPKCGTTWMQEIVWTMRNNPDLENPQAAAPVNLRCPFMELDAIMMTSNLEMPGPDHPLMQAFKSICGPEANPQEGLFLQITENLSKPRTMKTHLPPSLMPSDMLDKAKVIYVARNPKDVVVSFLHHSRLMKNHDYKGDLEQFLEAFINGDLLYGPYDLHLKEAFAKANHKNMMIVMYEDVKADPTRELKKLDKFLGTNLTDKQIENVVKYTSFDEMKKRDNVAGGSSEDEGGIYNVKFAKEKGGFFRAGKAGDWKEKLSKEQAAKIDEWTKEKLGDSDISFKYA